MYAEPEKKCFRTFGVLCVNIMRNDDSMHTNNLATNRNPPEDVDHNTSNALLLLCGDALIAPVLLAGLSDVDELKVALGCRFAPDVFTIAQDHSLADQALVICDLGRAFWC